MDIQDVAKNINKPVIYQSKDGPITLTLNACILRKYNNKFYYTAELGDSTNRSVSIVPLERVNSISI